MLLHGLGTAAPAYAAVVRLLRRRAARILLPELPGHGRSLPPPRGLEVSTMAAGLREALDQVLRSQPPATLLGTSLGGAAALGYALERPERVRALILASPAGAPLDDGEMLELRARFNLRTRADARRFFAELSHEPPWYTRALELGLVQQLGRPDVQSFLSSLAGADFFDADALASLVPPTLVLWGKSDRVLPRSGLSFYRRTLPAATRFEELDGIGHSPHFEKPALVVDRLVAAHHASGAR